MNSYCEGCKKCTEGKSCRHRDVASGLPKPYALTPDIECKYFVSLGLPETLNDYLKSKFEPICPNVHLQHAEVLHDTVDKEIVAETFTVEDVADTEKIMLVMVWLLRKKNLLHVTFDVKKGIEYSVLVRRDKH